MMNSRIGHFALLLTLLVAVECNADGGLRKNFYENSCPQAEELVREITWNKSQSDPTLGAKLLRLHYHDCFVQGCDGSILLDPVGTSQSEKNAGPSFALAGFDDIDDIKEQVEKACPDIVSCADIVTLAARDAVSFPFKKPMWEVLTGRRDGNVSLVSEVEANMPSPLSNFSTLARLFSNQGLSEKDLVVLSGAHTIGVAHCGAFSNRLYNFTGNGDADPSLDTTYAAFLRTQCPNLGNSPTTVEMDPQSSLSFDSDYFKIVTENKGLFHSDASLLTNRGAAKLVQRLRSPAAFFSEFGKSVKKMGAISVLTGTAGEIRRQCRVVNQS